MVFCRSAVVLTIILGLLAIPTSSEAKRLKKDRVDVFQLKSVTKKRRHEFTPLVSMSMNDPFLQTFSAGLNYSYHISEGFAFEVRGAFSTSRTTALVDQLRSGDEIIDPANPQKKNIFNPSLTPSLFYAHGDLVWSPLVGKFVLGKRIFENEFYICAGLGYVRTTQDHLMSSNFGVGWRIFLSRWMALRIDLIDYIYTQKLPGAGGADIELLSHNVSLSFGLSFFFPFTPVYTF